jgi:GTP-binding protein HflX
VLAEIGAEDAPRMLLLNKIDRVDEARRAELSRAWPDALQLCAKQPEDVAALRERILEHFERDAIEAELLVPWDRQRVAAEARRTCRVLAESHEEHGTRLRLRGPAEAVEKLRGAL